MVAAGLALVVAGGVLMAWGTGWTVPRATAAAAGYTLTGTWHGGAAPGGDLQRPIGVAVAPGGNVYVTDARARVVRFDRSGEVTGQWGTPGDGPGEFRNPVGIAVSHDGFVYVSDYEQDRIQKFTADGEFVLAFGRPGAAPGEFDAPAGLAVDDAGLVHVADFYNHRVQVWRPDGSFVRAVGRPGRIGDGALHYPTGVVHVADSGHHRVVMLSSEGAQVAEWRLDHPQGSAYSPEQVAVSADGRTVYATDLAGDRLLVLEATPPR